MLHGCREHLSQNVGLISKKCEIPILSYISKEIVQNNSNQKQVKRLNPYDLNNLGYLMWYNRSYWKQLLDRN